MKVEGHHIKIERIDSVIGVVVDGNIYTSGEIGDGGIDYTQTEWYTSKRPILSYE